MYITLKQQQEHQQKWQQKWYWKREAEFTNFLGGLLTDSLLSLAQFALILWYKDM